MAINKRKRFEVFARDGFVCMYCGKTPPDAILEVDHIIPKSKGGDDELINLTTSCFDCNRGKSNIKLDTVTTRPDIGNIKAELAEQLEEMKQYYAVKNELQGEQEKHFNKVLDYWYENVSSYMSNKQQASIRVFLNDFDFEEIINAIDIARCKVRGWSMIFRYMCGILHNWKKGI
jgi:DNA replication protein DnaD